MSAGLVLCAGLAPASGAALGDPIVTVGCVTATADVISVDVPASQAPAAIAALPQQTSCDVAGIEQPMHALIANDTFRRDQWALDKVSFEDAWSVATGAGVTVAVIDTGVQSAHPDLAGQVLLGRDYVTGVASGWTATDPSTVGHGTHVAGIVAATANNSAGITGAAPDARILPIRVLDSTGSGTSTNVAAGVTWAVANGADVVNLSLGTSSDDPTLRSAIAQAIAAGVVVVAATGNESSAAVLYPAAYDGVIAVGATTSADAHASFSNRGPQIAVAAPGSAIYSTLPSTAYGYLSGTSMATPYAAAEAALILQAHPAWSPAQVRSSMMDSAKDLVTAPASLGWDAYTGAGLINPSQALCGGTCTPVDPPTVTSLSAVAGGTGGGTSVTITGTNFTGATAVTFGGVSASGLTVNSATSVTVTTPAHDAGDVAVAVTSPRGTGTLAAGFRYVAAPAISSVAPSDGSTAGGTSVTITGTGLTGATTVAFDGTLATAVTASSDTTLTATAPAHSAGAVSVAVTSPYGTGTVAAAFTYVAPDPVVVAPGGGAPPAGGSSGGASSGSSSSSSAGASSGSSAGGGSTAAITEVRPAFGPIGGGTRILILGYGFWGASGVTIGGRPATSFRSIDAATLEVVTPPGDLGWQSVVVTLPVGDTKATFNYQAAGPATEIVATTTAPPAAPVVRVLAPAVVRVGRAPGGVLVAWADRSPAEPVRQFVTAYRSGSEVRRVALGPAATRAVVRGLPAGTYRFAVTVVGSDGSTDRSPVSRRVRVAG